MTVLRPALILALLCAIAAATPAAAAPTTIDALPRESPVDAGQGAVVWSRYDATIDAYRMVVRRGGVNTVPAIAPSRFPFEADMGSDAKGRPAVVYSRCASYAGGRAEGCDLYLLSLTTGTERKLTAANTSANESLPTLWRGRLAWVRGRQTATDAVYLRSLSAPASRKSTRLPGVPARACNIHNSTPCRRVTDGGIEELELHGERLAEIVSYATAGGGDSTEIRLVSVRSRTARRIAFQNIGENNQEYLGLSFASGRVAWHRDCFENPGCAGSGAYRMSVAGGLYSRALDRSTYAGWAWTGTATYTSQLAPRAFDCRSEAPAPAAPCLVLRDPDPAWKRVAARNVL